MVLIYIMMAYNIKIFFYIYEVFDDKYWWVTSYEIVVRNIYLKGLFLHPNVIKFHLLSYLTPPPPFISPYIYIRGIIGVEILGRQKLQTVFVELKILLLFYGIKLCIGELFCGCFVFGELELWLLWSDSRLLVFFI